MIREKYCAMAEQFRLSEERDEQILQTLLAEERKQHTRRPAFFLKKGVLAAALITLLLASVVTVTAIVLKSDVFRDALGDGVTQWEEQISGKEYATMTMEHYQFSISNVLCTASSINYVATFEATDDIGRGTVDRMLPNFDFHLQQPDGTFLDFGYTTYMKKSHGQAGRSAQYVCSHLLDTAAISEDTTLSLGCILYEGVVIFNGSEDETEGAVEPGKLLDSGSFKKKIGTVDTRQIAISVNDANVQRVVLTPVSVLFYGNEAALADSKNGSGIGGKIHSFELIFENGEVWTLVSDQMTDCEHNRGGIGNVTPTDVTYFIGMEAIDLSQVVGIRLNEQYYSVLDSVNSSNLYALQSRGLQNSLE